MIGKDGATLASILSPGCDRKSHLVTGSFRVDHRPVVEDFTCNGKIKDGAVDHGSALSWKST